MASLIRPREAMLEEPEARCSETIWMAEFYSAQDLAGSMCSLRHELIVNRRWRWMIKGTNNLGLRWIWVPVFPLKIPTLAWQNPTFLLYNTTTKIMAKTDKSALISKMIASIRAREFADCSKAAAFNRVDRTSISKRVGGLTRPKKRSAHFTTDASPTTRRRP